MSANPPSELGIPQPGEAAPDFTLPDAEGKPHHLAEQRGRWTVVYFYPTDDTPGCTTEACEFRDANQVMAARGAAVWGISPQGARSKAAFRGKFALNFPLLTDADHAVTGAYGSWVEKARYGRRYKSTARRTFLVDPDGRLVRVWEKVKPEGHAADVLGALEAAQAARATSGAEGR